MKPERETERLRFEDLVRRALESQRFRVVDSGGDRDHSGYDFHIRSSTDVEGLVEIKFYSTLRVSWSTLRRSFNGLASAMRRASIERGLFVTNASVSASMRTEANEQGIVVYDYDFLWHLVGGSPDLGRELNEILQTGLIYRSEPLPRPNQVKQSELTFGRANQRAAPHSSAGKDEPTSPGQSLCRELRQIKALKAQATVYEVKCIEILKYLFEDDLIGWTP